MIYYLAVSFAAEKSMTASVTTSTGLNNGHPAIRPSKCRLSQCRHQLSSISVVGWRGHDESDL
jgi:hypothetical protein